MMRTMDTLKEQAVRVYTGMMVVYPFNQEEALNISGLTPKFNGRYATNNSTVCFVSEDQVFVTPYTREAMNALSEAGFIEDCFFVPFSNGDYPKSEEYKWNHLRELARQSYAREFSENCVSYCEKHGIGAISEETLQNCFEMPSNGVEVKHLNFEDCYFPALRHFDCTVGEKIGHYCTNNGRVVFVYRDGKTYVTKGYKILRELEAAGYTEAGLFVPFSNGEQIKDVALRNRWESIKK